MDSALRRFAVHTVTTKPWRLERAVDEYARAGFGGISIWRDAVKGRPAGAVRRLLREAGLRGVSLVRGGFFAHRDARAYRDALEDNRRCIDEAHRLGIPLIVLVCGADPQLKPIESRRRITDALMELAPEAAAAGVRLGIEPLHPMYTDTRSAVNTLGSANRIARAVNAAADSCVGRIGAVVCSVVDVYHLWWDEHLEEDIAEAGAHNLLGAFHVCDWRVPTEHMLLDRALMGEGCIDIPAIMRAMEGAGFDVGAEGSEGCIEVEIFSEREWAGDQREWLQRIAAACLALVPGESEGESEGQSAELRSGALSRKRAPVKNHPKKIKK